MKLKVLTDNNTFIDEYYLGEPGVCYYIEEDGEKILFDTGYSDVFIKNAEAFGIDLGKISKIIISHGHNDHTRGLSFFFEKFKQKPEIIAHPNAFYPKYDQQEFIGSPYDREELEQLSKLTLSKEPVSVTKNLIFLGEIPCYHEFEKRKQIGYFRYQEKDYKDYVIEDSALAYQTEKGIYIITGCSHSGICNIIEHAKLVCNDIRILGVLGGFHMLLENDRSKETISYFQKSQIKQLYPCHCTSFLVKAQFHRTIPVKEVGVGLELNW